MGSLKKTLGNWVIGDLPLVKFGDAYQGSVEWQYNHQ